MSGEKSAFGIFYATTTCVTHHETGQKSAFLCILHDGNMRNASRLTTPMNSHTFTKSSHERKRKQNAAAVPHAHADMSFGMCYRPDYGEG
jgi:hypothetical protein